MLRNKLETLFSKNSDPVKKQKLISSAFRYSLDIISSKELNDDAREAGVFEEIKKLKPSFLKGHEHTLSNMRKAVTVATQRESCTQCSNYNLCVKFGLVKTEDCTSFAAQLHKISKKYQVPMEDLALIECLEKKDIKELQKKYAKRLDKNQSMSSVLKTLGAWTTRFVWKKFKFILTYYRDIEIRDIVQDLLIEGLARAVECDSMESEQHFINTIKQRIIQRANNWLEHYVRESRRRVVRNEEDYKQQINNLASIYKKDSWSFDLKEKTFKHQVSPQYDLIQKSLDVTPDSEENLYSFIGHTDPDNLEESSLKEILLQNAPDDTYSRIFKIFMGDHDSEYAYYLKKNDLDFSTNTILAFFGIPKNVFFNVIRDIFTRNNIVTEERFDFLRNA